MLHKRMLVLVFVIVLSIFSKAFAQDLEVAVEGLYPEGIAYDAANNRFFVSSAGMGTIYAVDAETGEAALFAEDEALITTLGLHVDTDTNRLLVAVSDSGVSAGTTPETAGVTAKLGIFDLESGETLNIVDLGGLLPNQGHFANDVTTDADGNAYITDSFSPVIYKVTPEGEASVFLESESFTGEGFNLNGIVYLADGFLIAGQYATGTLYNIPLDDPEAFTAIKLPEPVLFADGLTLLDETHLLVVTNALGAGDPIYNQVIVLVSEDGWQTAEMEAQTATDLVPTTAAVRDNVPNVLFGQMNMMFDPNNTTPATSFTILPFADLVSE